MIWYCLVTTARCWGWLDESDGMQVAGTSGVLRVEDFVIPRSEKTAQFQVRDGQFLANSATRVSQAAEERTVRPHCRLLTGQCMWITGCSSAWHCLHARDCPNSAF